MIARRHAVVVAVAAALAAQAAAAQVRGVPRVAVLDWEPAGEERIRPFLETLRELGHVRGETIQVAYVNAGASSERAAAFAAEIVGARFDVIVALTTPAGQAVKQATSTIPIVVAAADPVGAGLVSNLARPGGNITGASNMMPDLESKRIELLRELLPGLSRIAFLGSARDPATQNFVREAQAAATRSGIRLDPVLIADAAEIDGALAAMARDGVGAVLVQPLFALSAQSAAGLAQAAARHRIPAVTHFRHFPQSGGLMSYGPMIDFSQRVAARHVDRILKGARPGDLPIEQPTHFELVLNLRTAAALGLTVPPSLLQRADELID